MAIRRDLTVLLTSLFCTTALFWTLEPAAQDTEAVMGWQEELAQINEELEIAEDQRDLNLAAARRAEDQGMRWQFMQDQKQEAKRAFERAEDKKQVAAMYQARIDELNARKMQILQEHPEGLNG